MIQTSKRYKKGNALIDKSKEQNVWVYHQKSESIVLVSTDPKFIYPDDMYEANTSDLMELRQNHSKSIKTKIKIATNEEKWAKNELDSFFDTQAETMPYNCDECNKPLYAFTRFAKRCVTAHILPKAYFKSIKTHPLNVFYLGADLLGVCDHHDSWDKNGIEHRKKMNVYSLALERYELLKPFLTDAEIVSADKYLGL